MRTVAMTMMRGLAMGVLLTMMMMGDPVTALPRQLQAGGGRPDKCGDDSSFQAWLALVNAACV
jgi:hypothetical protein